MQNYYNPYQNNYGYQNYQPQQQMQMPRQNNTIFVFVNGIDEARTYILSPNQTAYLLDNNSNHLFIKKADMSGRYVMEDYILTKAEQENEDFVKKSDLLQLQNQINALTQAVAGLTQPKEG